MTFHQGKRAAFRIVLAMAWIGYAALCFAASPDLTKPLPGRLRGGYMGESDFNLLAMMSRNGMNAAIAKFGRIAVPLGESSEATIRKWADECDRLNLAFLPVFNWWGADEARWMKDYNHVVTGSGKFLENTPCPYTRDFWDRAITPRAVAIGRSLKGRPLAAVCIDMEMYGAESVHYQDGCYCDQCFARFLQAEGQPGKIPAPADRGRIIKDAGKLDAYQAVQREAARTFAAASREAVHNVRPGLRFGVLHLDEAIPVQQGLALGFGTPDLPVLCLTERTYSSGHTPYIASAQESFRAMGAYVDVLVGFWQSRFPPENVAEQLYHIAQDTYGYWIYTMQTFGKADYHPLPGTPEDYWTAIREANRELDKLGADGAYRTALRIRRFEPPAMPLPWGEFHKYDFFSGSGAAPQMPGVWLRGTNWIYFYAKQGDRIAFELTRKQIGSYADSTRAGMVSPAGTRLAEGTARKDRPAALQAVAPETGVYGLVVVAGAVAAELTRASHPYAAYIAGPGGAGFVTRLPPLFVALSPDAATVEFEFVTDNSAEAVKATVLSENGAELWSGVVEGATKVRIGKPSGSRVRLKFERLPGHTFEDVRVRGVNGVLPFAATDPSGLLIGRPAPLQ